MRQVNSKVATVIPEIGFDDEPISPVSRDDTVTNRNPNARIKSAPSRFIFNDGEAQIAAISPRHPSATNVIGRSLSVRGTAPVRPRADNPKSDRPERIP